MTSTTSNTSTVWTLLLLRSVEKSCLTSFLTTRRITVLPTSVTTCQRYLLSATLGYFLPNLCRQSRIQRDRQLISRTAQVSQTASKTVWARCRPPVSPCKLSYLEPNYQWPWRESSGIAAPYRTIEACWSCSRYFRGCWCPGTCEWLSAACQRVCVSKSWVWIIPQSLAISNLRGTQSFP